jgi:hypothetical protein
VLDVWVELVVADSAFPVVPVFPTSIDPSPHPTTTSVAATSR